MSNTNKKILNASPLEWGGIKFKSKFEAQTYKLLREEGFNPTYEGIRFKIWEGLTPTVQFYDKDPKTGLLKLNMNKLRDITYIPDFIFIWNNVEIIIEIKGFENDVFPIKKKLFRKFLESWNKPILYFEIYNKKQLIQAIEIIKNQK